MTRQAYVGVDIFDGQTLHRGKAIVLDDGIFCAVIDAKDIPDDTSVTSLNGGTVLPGFIDLQVNGGGGVMFNDDTNCAGLARIANAHLATGTRAFLPTLITDTKARTHAAVDAVEAAIAKGVDGIIGIHLEGPHLSLARKGAHDPALIRPMTAADAAFLCDAARRLPNVMVTMAPENVSIAQIRQLTDAGVIVALGHTDCDFAQAMAAFDAGARCVTHLFNAMSQTKNRAPGLVGAALDAPQISAGLIADNIHVHAANMRMALGAKRGPGTVFLVTDAMATLGSDITEFTLNGRRVLRQDGQLCLQDGTLAGADLDLPKALQVLINTVGVAPAAAFAMATTGPAAVLSNALGFGTFTSGRPWHGIYLDAQGDYRPLQVTGAIR